MTDVQQTSPDTPRIGVVDVVRFLCEVFAIVSLGIWGFVQFPFGWNIAVGLGAPVVAILLWALFRAPKAVLAVDPFVKAIVEIVVMGSAAFAWADMGQWIVAAVFAAVALVTGVIAGRKEF
ncbi:YrdB family protein [Gryllotalpicola ginsengisoli]|uniref:YrdB family protein n=1 Tax=Gryllotalpicola ginsengisoli TaxID=444608 RepID=UPI0003B5554F|nr:YrdB family protein [Gryllotalpicola ginsengisoli]